jgi:tRNA threonylcarbamoyl adenosine modification protein (Sua5/YciO/YrdC/YwlC family)
LEAAARAVLDGGLIVFPTETVYGIAALPIEPASTGRLFEAKARSMDLSLPVLVPTVEGAWEIAQRNAVAEALGSAFWPGPLTLVLPRTALSSGWKLGSARHSIAVRVPGHPLTRALLALTGPLATSSANASGEPPLEGREALTAAFGPAVSVYLVLAAGVKPPAGRPSTVVDVSAGRATLLRKGAIDPAALHAALTETGGEVQWVHFD